MARFTPTFWLFAVAVHAMAVPHAAQGIEPAQEFVDGLRRRQLHDVALDYLQRLRESRRSGEEFLQKLDYEEGVTWAESAILAQDPELRSRHLRSAVESFRRFATQSAQHPLFGEALVQQGRLELLLGEEAASKADLASQADNHETLLAEAREWFGQAESTYNSARKYFTEQLEKLPRNRRPNREAQAKRARLREGAVLSWLQTAQAVFRQAQTYAEGDAQARQHFERARDLFDGIHEKNSKNVAGMTARLRQGWCYQALGDLQRALGCVNDVWDSLATGAGSRDLFAEATELFLEIALADEADRLAEALDRGTQFLDTVGQPDMASPTERAILYWTAVVHQRLAAQQKNRGSLQRKHLAEARRLAREVASTPGKFQEAAVKLVESAGGAANTEEETADTFTGALAAAAKAKDAWHAAVLAEREALSAGRREEAKRQSRLRVQLGEAAIGAYRQALFLADEETPTDEQNLARYYLCYLYLDVERFEEAAVLGSWLARSHSDSGLAHKCASVGLLALHRLATQSESQSDFAWSRLENLSQQVMAAWPQTSEAAQAATFFVQAAARRGDVQAVQTAVQRLAASDAVRGETAIAGGRALWEAFSRDRARDVQENPELPPAAQELLVQGRSWLKRDEAPEVFDLATILLGQIALDTSDLPAAQRWLEAPDHGIGQLARAESSPHRAETLLTAAVEVALRIHVLSGSTDNAIVDQLLARLEQLSGKDGASQARLSRVYFQLGREMTRRIEALRTSGKTAEAEQATRQLTAFLDRLAGRQQGQSLAGLYWMATTLEELGSPQESAYGSTSRNQNYLRQATEIYARLLKHPELSGTSQAARQRRDAVRFRLAGVQHRSRQYAAAWQTLREVLSATPNLLTAQVLAARVLQDWGEQEPSRLQQAVLGTQEQGVSVWGWGTLSKITARKPELRDHFYEARLRLAECRFQLAKTAAAEKRGGLFRAAKNDLVWVAKRYPDFASSAWYAAYDKLLREIQRQAGEPARGLQEIAPPTESLAQDTAS